MLAFLAIRVVLTSIPRIRACDFRRAGGRAADQFFAAPQVEYRAHSAFIFRAIAIGFASGRHAGSSLAIAIRSAQPSGAVGTALAFVDDAKVPAIPARSRGTLHGQPGHQETACAVAIVIRATLVPRNLDLAFGHRHMQVPARAWSFGPEFKARGGRWLICALGVRAAAGLGHKVSALAASRASATDSPSSVDHFVATTTECK